jgi:hypothetical protein
MTPDKQRIAIATACGWTDTQIIDGKYGQTDVPDYLGDLNAMHEAEKVLNAAQRITYADQLCILWTGRDDRAVPIWFWITEATAAQRAEAFIRTLNLWTTTPTQPQ